MHWTFFISRTKRFVRGEKNKLRRRRWQSWNSKLVTQHKSLVTAFIFIFCFYFFFFLFFLLLLFLLFVSTAVVSHLLFVWVCFEVFFMFPKPLRVTWHWFMWLGIGKESRAPTRDLALGKKKIFDFWNWQNVSAIRFASLSPLMWLLMDW